MYYSYKYSSIPKMYMHYTVPKGDIHFGDGYMLDRRVIFILEKI